jgi:hypothetical protein
MKLVRRLIYLAGVGVAVLGVDATVGLDVLEGAVHQTTVAAQVAVSAGAVDQVLFAEGDKLTSLLEELALQGAGLQRDEKSKVYQQQL